MVISKTLTDTNVKRISAKNLIVFVFVCISFLLVLFSVSSEANAASLYLSPSSGSYSVGQTATISVYVGSNGAVMNAASGNISFPTDKLQVISISRNGSVMDLWVQEPSFSNSAGTVSFEGIVLNPGFTGSAGRIINISFRVKSSGSGAITFSSGSVLANDGNGTNILDTLGNATLDLTGRAPSADVAVPSADGVPPAPVISSSTHSDSQKWYANDTAKFKWNIPSGTTGAKLLIGKRPTSAPTVTYIPPISSKTVDDLDDGVWYFHVRLRNDVGWGDTTHFKLQVDTTKPSAFSIERADEDDTTNPQPSFIFDAEDETSGISHFEIAIDNGESIKWTDDGEHTYKTSLLNFGDHKMTVKVIDGAGNYLEESIDFTIDPLSATEITEYPNILEKGESLIIEGETKYKNSQVMISLQKDGEEIKVYEVLSDENGEFILKEGGELSRGDYKLWAQILDDRGAKSDISEKVNITVRRVSFSLGDIQAVNVLIFISIILLIIAWYAHHTFVLIRQRVRKEADEAENALHNAFELLRSETEKHIEKLEKKGKKKTLTREEKRVMRLFKKNLSDAEKFIGKEIDDINRVI